MILVNFTEIKEKTAKNSLKNAFFLVFKRIDN
jgi:hypothetical protein